MNAKKYRYLIEIQYLGFRYSGWQKQPAQLTVEGMLLKTLKFILPEVAVKVLGAGRTDAKVSAASGSFALFTNKAIQNLDNFIQDFNNNLPPDIKILNCNEVADQFNVIKDVHKKEYHYYFSFGSKSHPFAAPFMANFPEILDVEAMTKAAALFQGTHNFKSYTVRQKENAQFRRDIDKCILMPNTELTASFFPEKSYCLQVIANGFMRYQVRMIMGVLIQLGRGVISQTEIEASLKEGSDISFSFVAPGSGLILQGTHFKNNTHNI